MEELPNYKQLYENLLMENNELKEHLKKYTAPKRNKEYYHNNKDKIKEKQSVKKTDPEKIKEYNKRAYEKRKLKNNKIN
jgi:hypothetical protein